MQQDRSNTQQPAIDIGPISRIATGFAVELFVRWNEQVTNGEYIYDAYRFIYPLPVEVEPGLESVTYYLDAAKTAILQLAQAMATQETDSMLSDEKKKLLSDLAIGKNVTSSMTTADQLAAIRKQMDNVLASNSKIVVDADYKALSELVAKEKKSDTKKS